MQATQSSSITNAVASFYFANLAGVNDIAFTTDKTSNEARILKRDSSGNYNLFATKQLQNTSLVATTNGEWFGAIYSEGIELFRVDQNGQVHDYSILETNTEKFSAKLQDDGSLMVAFTDYILTYEFVNSQWVVTQNSSFPGASFFLSSFVSAAIPNNAFITLSTKQNSDNVTYNIYIVARQADKSWKIVESIAVNQTLLTTGQSYFWDGKDTFICTVASFGGGIPYGSVFVFNKNNGQWEISQYFSAAEVGVAGSGFFGVGPLVALDDNHVLVPAPADKLTSEDFPPGTGSVHLMQRNQQNEWSFVAKFNSNMSMFGAGLAKNDHDALVFGCTPDFSNARLSFNCSLFTIPTCIVEPIEFTCNQKQDSCSTDFDNLVVVNNPSCGQVSTSIDRVSGDKSGIVVDITLSRPLVADAKCSVTLTCPELTSVSSGHVLIGSMALIAGLIAAITL